MGARKGLKQIFTYIPESMLPDLRERLASLGKSQAMYIRDLIARDLKRHGVDTSGLASMSQGRPRNPEEENE